MNKYDWSDVGQDEANIASSRLASEVRARIGAPSFSLPAARDAALAELLASSAATSVLTGATGDGVNDDSAAIQAALDAASDGMTIVIPPGTYLAANLTVTGKSIYLYGPGATLKQASDAPILTFRGGWGTPLAITGQTATTYDFSNGAGVTTDVTKLDFASAPALVAGDIVKVVSDDQLAAATTATRRRGEFAVVGAVSGSSVYLTGRLLDTYTTAPRIAKLAGYTFGLDGFSLDSALSGAWTNALVLITAARDVSVRHVRVLQGGGPGIKITGCHGFSVHDYRASNLANSPSASQFGYGLQLSGSESGSVSHCTFTRCRHGFTTDASTSDAGSDLIERFGRTRHVTISHSHGRGCSNSAFDCHNDAFDVSFDHCSADAEVRGEDSTGAPFQVRGKQIKLNHCRGRGRYGVAIYDDGGGATDDVLLHDCTLEGQVGAIFSDSLGSGTGVTGLVIEGGRYTSHGFYGLQLVDCGITLRKSPTFVLLGTTANTRFCDLTNSIVTIDHVTVDLAGCTATDIYCLVFRDATSYVIGERLRVEISAADLDTFARGLSAGWGTLELKDIVFVGAEPTTFSANLLDTTLYSWRSEAVAGPATSAVRAQDLSADDVALDIADVYDPVIYIRVAALVSDKLLGAIPVGYPGQQLFIRSFSAGGFTVTVRNGASYNTDMNANKVLANGDVVHLICTTAASQPWVLLSHYDRP